MALQPHLLCRRPRDENTGEGEGGGGAEVRLMEPKKGCIRRGGRRYLSGSADDCSCGETKASVSSTRAVKYHPRTGERVVGGVGLAGIINPAILCRFLRWFPTEEETTRPGGTRQERDKLW